MPGDATQLLDREWAMLRADERRDAPSELDWRSAVATQLPISVAQAFARIEQLDESDVWLRTELTGPFEGSMIFPRLGPLADIFVDGALSASTQSLFRSHAIQLRLGPGAHELAISLRSPARFLGEKRPRPRWKTRLVSHQQLRWLRAPLLGRMPGWAPSGAARGILERPRLVPRGVLDLDAIRLRVSMQGPDGRVQVGLPAGSPADLRLRVGDTEASIADGGELRLREPPRWWPHTHGPQTRLPVTLRQGQVEHTLGQVGFRTITVEDPRRFALRCNDVPIFCRGAVFVPDAGDDAAADRDALASLRDAGGNMIRVGGTMRYEDDAFFDACDELGLLVWQDFMFANMDYPIGDDGFRAEIERELDERCARWARHASVAVLCGGSEVAQQAAMLGQPADRWYGPLFESVLPELAHRHLPDLPYVLNSPSSPLDADGSDAPPPLPFRPDVGVAHYYGLGAYLRPFEDARRADVSFASECLALANVPEPERVDAIFGDAIPVTHSPSWKAGVPRDHGAGWDFEDVRDHYHGLLFGIDPVRDRAVDPDGYLERARITSCEVLTRGYSEWRRAGSSTHGGLVWFLRDLVPGAGWGLLDSEGGWKAPLWAAKRVWAPTALLLTDEGNSGLRLHVAHEGATARKLKLRVTLYRDDATLVAEAERELIAQPRSTKAYDVEGLFGAFRDVGHAYRFGPRGHDLVLAQLLDGDALVGEAAHLFSLEPRADPGLHAEARRIDERRVELHVSAERIALYVAIRAPGWRAEDGYFHLAPGEHRRVELRQHRAGPLRGLVHAFAASPAGFSLP